MAVNPHERNTRRSNVRSATCAPRQLPEGGPLMWMMFLHINQKPDDDDDDISKPDLS